MVYVRITGKWHSSHTSPSLLYFPPYLANRWHYFRINKKGAIGSFFVLICSTGWLGRQCLEHEACGQRCFAGILVIHTAPSTKMWQPAIFRTNELILPNE